jgi:ketosteroid isomerase-like protein
MDPIRDLLHAYADAVCHDDADRWIATWVDDAVWDLGAGHESAGRDAILELWLSAMARYRSVLHRYENSAATVDPDRGTGHGRAYVTEVLHPVDGPPLVMHGYYDDEYRLDDGRWRFARRELVRLYQGPPDYSGFTTTPPD